MNRFWVLVFVVGNGCARRSEFGNLLFNVRNPGCVETSGNVHEYGLLGCELNP